MKQNLQGIPSTIEVDGKTYNVRYSGRWFRVTLNDKLTLEVGKFSDVAEKIRLAEKELADQREGDRQERALKRAQEKQAPIVWARLRHTNEKVQVRGRSSRSSRWDHKFLITRADGTKETVPGYVLISLSSDEGTLDKIEAEETIIKTEVAELTKAGRLEDILNTLRQATLDITYDADSNLFTGTYDGLSATLDYPGALENQIEKLAIGRERPWTTVTEQSVTTVVALLKSDKVRFASYDRAWASQEDAERYAVLQNQLVALGQRRSLASEDFNYSAELAAVKA